ncbi:MAG: TrmH family RNA methyltransferase [Candidatus Absconditabacteria bacterium]|nr:TrmH family RNA methyltransferase [Candidatus Absconditabacteria bacterium]MDD3868774.1 TrmH family RNA methyltransferase [Candidatus Absconditabacteria bacterium]MDD4713923.1 TrmH family RNA methyltransferase [Candidatus Absconditabacteria bacterium]
MKVVILENIRSAYNVGNVIRTADALGWKVWIIGYTPSPLDNPKVRKTSLGAEESVGIEQFDSSLDAINRAKELGLQVIAAEITDDALALGSFEASEDIAMIFGNEVEGVLSTTLQKVDQVVFIPMGGVKESFNIGQSAAIFMWELGK